jgi:type IX secretion system PorP/SprF family membrane protein
MDGHPRTLRFNGFGNISKHKWWLGGDMYFDQTDIIGRFKANLSLSYKLQVQNNQFLFFGIWGSFYQNIVRYSDAIGVDPSDPLFSDPARISKAKFNGGFGISYNWQDLYLGFAFPTLFQNRYEIDNGSGILFAFKREFLVHASYMFHLSKNWDLQAYSVFRKTVNDPLNFDLSLMAIVMKRFWFGALYRDGGMIALNLGGNLVGGLVLNYSYEIGVGGVASHTSGSHEITLGWRFGFKSKHNRYFDPYNVHNNYKEQKARKVFRDDYPPIYDFTKHNR